MQGKRESFSFQGKDTHLVCMESFFLFNPGYNSGRDGGHGKDHGGKLLV